MISEGLPPFFTVLVLAKLVAELYGPCPGAVGTYRMWPPSNIVIGPPSVSNLVIAH